jgi:hypothetical protein
MPPIKHFIFAYLIDLIGGARRNRTDDLFNAIEALSQLSYDPKPSRRLKSLGGI